MALASAGKVSRHRRDAAIGHLRGSIGAPVRRVSSKDDRFWIQLGHHPLHVSKAPRLPCDGLSDACGEHAADSHATHQIVFQLLAEALVRHALVTVRRSSPQEARVDAAFETQTHERVLTRAPRSAGHGERRSRHPHFPASAPVAGEVAKQERVAGQYALGA